MHWANSRRSSRAAAVVLIVLVSSAIGAGSPASPARNSDLSRIRTEIARLRSRMRDVKAQTRSAEHDLEGADLELGIRTNELQLAIDMQSQVEQQRRDIEAQIASTVSAIGRQKSFLRKRLAALYRLGGLSYVRLLLAIDEGRDPVRGISMLSFLVSRDSRAVSRLQSMNAQLRTSQGDLVDRERQLRETRRVVEQSRREVLAARTEKERMLASLRSEGNQSEQKIAGLEEKARRLEHLLDVLSRQNGAAGAMTDIRAVQGALPWPIQGRIIERFGKQRDAKFSTVTFNNGLKIAAVAGTEVRSVFAGTVLFSQWFKGYGNLVILDHGNRVFSLYGNLKAPSVTAGDHISAGQVLAGVGESEDTHSGYLYFEIRQDNKPEDPQQWLR